MSSKEPSPLLDLAERLVTTEEDVAALRLARRSPRMTPEAYARFLATFAATTPADALRRRRGPSGPEPFSL